MFANLLSAQSIGDSLSFRRSNFNNQILRTNFQKQLNTFNLLSNLRYGGEFNNFFVGVNENFNSTVTKTTTKSIKDEQRLELLTEYAVNNNFRVGGFLKNDIYSDDRSLAINEASILNASLFAKYSPHNNLYVTPFGGISNNKQIGTEDKGFIYGIEGSIDELRYDDFGINSSVKFFNEDISPRKNTNRLFKVNLLNEFENSFSNLITANYLQQRKDFYFEADSITSSQFNVQNNIQTREETNYFLQDRIEYRPQKSNFMFDMLGRVSFRNIDRQKRYVTLSNISASSFDTRIEELKLDFASRAMIAERDYGASLKIEFSEKEEKHLTKRIEDANNIFYEERVKIESRKNNKSQIINLSASGNYQFSKSDNLAMSLFHRKLRYDTPSEENNDDRDELLTIARVLYTHSFSPFFKLQLNLEGSYNHIVYIFAERSSNNNIRRVLKLSTAGYYRGKNFASFNSFEVSANYTVYDFEDINPNIKSFSFRQFEYKDSTTLRLNRNIDFNLFGYLKLSEQGDFDWRDFKGRPVRFLQESYIEPKFYYRYKYSKFGIGIRYFSLITFGYPENSKEKESEYTSIGPLSEFTFNISNILDIIFSGWYEFINNEANVKRELVNMNFSMAWRF
jgi:hypothetical protein